jgi:hypothetical protein
MGPPGPQGAAGETGAIGPQGPAGPMPVYFAGWVRGNATVRFGGNFAVSRVSVAGSYRITISTALTPRFLATVVTPVSANRMARVVAFTQDAIAGVSKIDIEITDTTTGSLVDCDFNFIAMERS